VVVVGGGIAGLSAAWELSGGARPNPGAPRITVLESARRLGGPLHSELFEDRMVDVGPDGFLGRRPEAADLCREIGLGDQLVGIGASGASVYARGRLRALPAGLALGVPTRWWPVARSGVLGPAGSARLLLDAVAPRPDRRGPLGDRALGPLVSHRLGRAVVDGLVDPLVGGIHAGSVADMSSAAVMPMLLAVASQRGGLMRALRRADPAGPAGPPADPPPPVFWALDGGMRALIECLETQLRARGVEIRPQAAAARLTRTPGGWTVQGPVGALDADGVVLAVPADVAGDLLAPHDADAAAIERTIEYASVSVITLSVPAEGVSLPGGTGFLVPVGTPSPLAGSGDDDLLITACTFLDAKWPHLSRPDRVLLRASVGRFGDRRAEQMDDEQLANRVAAELAAVLGMTATPTQTMVTRWPRGFPQYRVGHLLRVSGIEAAVRRLPGLAVAGAAYRGVGIPACIASGREAARSLLGSSSAPAAAGSGPTS
jgi:oxygen-dependent protoporphyrinogen oxidase